MKIVELTIENAPKTVASTLLLQQATLQNTIVITFSDLTAAETSELVNLTKHYYVNYMINQDELTGVFTTQALQKFINHLTNQATANALINIQNQHTIIWQAGRQSYNLTQSGLVYAILNTTPDSFYDGGSYINSDRILKHITACVENGADIIEVGGQSTRPGYTEISNVAEIERIMPVIDLIQSHFPDMPIAVDTYKLGVMQAAINAGVDIINDINGFVDDPQKIELMRATNVGMVSMLNRRLMTEPISYENVLDTFKDQITTFEQNGIDLKRVAIDPGIGFSTVGNLNNDLGLMHGINQLNTLHLPIMTAVSNKSYLQKLLGLAKDDRVTMTLITEALMYTEGNRILRVHNVAETKQMRTLVDHLTASYLE